MQYEEIKASTRGQFDDGDDIIERQWYVSWLKSIYM